MPKTTVAVNNDGTVQIGPFNMQASVLSELASPEMKLDPKTKRYTGVTGSGVVLSEGRIGVVVPIKDQNGVQREVTVNFSVSRPAITEAEDTACRFNADASAAKKQERDSAVENRIKLITSEAERQTIEARKAEIAAYQSVGHSVVSAVTEVAARAIAQSVAGTKQ